MNPKLEQLDLEVLSAINRERQAALAREAQTASMLHGPARSRRGGSALRKVVMILCVIAPIVLWVAQVVDAAAGGGGGGGLVHRMV